MDEIKKKPAAPTQEQPQHGHGKHRLPEHPPTPDQLKPNTPPEGNGGVAEPAAFPPHN